MVEPLEQIFASCKVERKELIPLLQEIQEKLGYLSDDAMKAAAEFLHIPPSAVYGVATFYNQFRFVPAGKHPLKICLGTACHIQGSKLIMEAMERELDIKAGNVTPDHEFSLDRVACVGCCALAPVIIDKKTVYPRMTPFKVEEVLALLKEENAHGRLPTNEP